MWQETWSSTPVLLVLIIIGVTAVSPLVKFIDVWRVKERELTPEDEILDDRTHTKTQPIKFEGLGSRLLIYPGVDWGLLVIEHYGLWRRWHGATGRQKMKLTLASRLMDPWLVLPGMLCLERAKDKGRSGNLGEVQAIFFTRRQEEAFRRADKLIHEINSKLDRKEPVTVIVEDSGNYILRPAIASDNLDDITD
jgi:hypothetical protein